MDKCFKYEPHEHYVKVTRHASCRSMLQTAVEQIDLYAVDGNFFVQ